VAFLPHTVTGVQPPKWRRSDGSMIKNVQAKKQDVLTIDDPELIILILLTDWAMQSGQADMWLRVAKRCHSNTCTVDGESLLQLQSMD